jgi:hypothetical protein
MLLPMSIFLFWVLLSTAVLIYNRNYCFRPPWPTGIPKAAAAVFRGLCGTEGVAGNGHASRAWKGNDQQRIIISRARPPLFPAQ